MRNVRYDDMVVDQYMACIVDSYGTQRFKTVTGYVVAGCDRMFPMEAAKRVVAEAELRNHDRVLLARMGFNFLEKKFEAHHYAFEFVDGEIENFRYID